MKCLKIDKNQGFYHCSEEADYCLIDGITKDDILNLLDLATNKEVIFEMDVITGDNLVERSVNEWTHIAVSSIL